MERNIGRQIKQSQKALARAKEKGNLKEEAEALNFLGELLSKIDDHEEALRLHKSELRICEILPDKIGQAVAHRKIGECYASLGNYSKALHHQYKHLELGKAADSLPEQQRAYATIGRTYFMQGEGLHNAENFDEAKPLLLKAENSFKSSIQLSQSIQERKILPNKEAYLMKTRGISNLAYIYHILSLQDDEEFDGHYSKQSLALYKKALAISQKRMLSDETHRAHIQLTMYYRCRNKIDVAIHHAEEAVKFAMVARSLSWQIEALSELASIQLQNGDCDGARKSLKKCFRLSQDSESKSSFRLKLKPVVKILSLQLLIDESLMIQRFQLYEKIADKFCELECFQAAIDNYKKQEELFPVLEDLSNQQKASVYYSLGLTSSDLKNYRAAIQYFHKEMTFYSNPRELANTWTQIGIAMEKLSDNVEAESCYKRAVAYADQTADEKLQLKALSLLLEVQEKLKSVETPETREKLVELQLKSGHIEGENSEDICKTQQEQNTADDGEDSDALVDKELERTDDSDLQETRQSRMTKALWERKRNEKGETPLHRACIEGHQKKVQLLLEKKHPVNIPDNSGWAPLHEACNHGFTEIVKLLIESGANIDYQAECGTTPMQDAAINGHFDIVDLLLEKGASASLRDEKGNTALRNLERFFLSEKQNMDCYEKETYKKVHEKLKSVMKDTSEEKENNNPNFLSTLNGMGEIFDPEICTQEYNHISDNYLTSNSEIDQNLTSKSHIDQNFDVPTNYDNTVESNHHNLDADSIFDDDDLPSFSGVSQKSRTATDSTKEGLPNATFQYKDVIAHLGSANTLSKISSSFVKSSRAPKRPLNFDGLINDDDYVGDDWLIDDTEEFGSTQKETRPVKRSKTSTGGQHCVKTTKPSGAFSSSFLNQNGVRDKRSQKLISTKIDDFLLPEPEEKIVIDDDDITPDSVPTNTSQRKSVPTVKKSPLPMQVSPPATSQSSSFRIKVNINGKMFLIAVPGKTKTIGWLCERAALVYKQNSGMHPNLALYAGGSEEDACLLSNDDVVSQILQNNEQISAKIESWNTTSLSQRYEESCSNAKQGVHPIILTACRQSSTTRKIELKNKGISTVQLQPLVTSMTQQKIESIQLPGNNLRDSGIATLCEALQMQMSLNITMSECLLTELNLRCSNMTSAGLKHLTKTAVSGALKNLRILDISYNRLDDFSSEDLTAIVKFCGAMRTLSMSQCRITDRFFQNNYLSFKSAMQECTSLSCLDVSHNAFGTVGCELLLKSLPYNSVTKLNISGICDENNSLITRHIASYLKKEGCVLQTLHCGENHLTLMQLQKFVSDLQTVKSLRALDLSQNCQEESRLLSLLRTVKCLTQVSASSTHFKWVENLTVARAKKMLAGQFHDDILPNLVAV